MEAGRSSTRARLEAQDSLLEAQNAVTSALIDLMVARLNFYLDLELLRVNEEGMHLDEDLVQRLQSGVDQEQTETQAGER